jgi:Flp pilus assembly protein TadG
MFLNIKAAKRRKGTAVIEFALIALPLFSLLFGILEYSRFLMELNLVTNAAREGCRYALANNTSTTISSDVTNLVTAYMGGQANTLSNFTVSVTGTHAGVTTAVNNLTAGDSICVTITGTYKFLKIIPLAKLPTTYAMTSSVTMICEGGT